MHLYTTYVDGIPYRVCMDAGVQQGVAINPLENKHTGLRNLPDAVVMSHSHLDHCGNLPLLRKE